MQLDSKQIEIQDKLSQLAQTLEKRVDSGFFEKIFSTKESIKSFYIYGDVGRGKSMLMKNFFNSLQKTPKTYFHFNAFMQGIHLALRDIRKEEKKYKDELIEALQRVIKDASVICFDEFQVLDIADAMLLSRIFSYIFSKEIIVVFTSNSKPLELYKNGLQRQVFLEFVENILLKNCEVLHLNSPTDYRQKFCQNLAQRYFISNKKNREEVQKIIENLTNGKLLKTTKIKVWGREIKIKKTFQNIAVIKFDELCKANFAAADYRAICQQFELIFLLKVPQLKKEDVDEARRFVLFIDEVYENKLALIVIAKKKAEEIYMDGIGAEAFKRTVSRLKEIQSDHYWNNSKINLKNG
jgi:cell division protein ZapE